MVIIPPHSFPVFTALWNESQRLHTPRPHRIIAAWLGRQWESVHLRLLLMAFRGCGKSTLTALFAAWLLVRNPNLRIMVVAADMLLAQKMVRNIRRMVEKHPLSHHLVPPQADQWSALEFTVQRHAALRDASVVARSIKTNITGSRADVIICDDVEVPGTADTPHARADLREKLRELEYVLVPGGTLLYLGTPHTEDSIYAAVPPAGGVEDRAFLAEYTRLAIPLLNDHGDCAWPERYPPEKINALRASTGPNRFASQMLLQPVSHADARLSPDLLREYAEDLRYQESNRQSRLWLGDVQLVGASCWWDPAFSGARDNSVVALVFSDAAGNYYLHQLLYLKIKPDALESEAAQQCNAVAEFLRENYVPAIRVESNGVGQFLPGMLRQTLTARGIGCAVQSVHSRGNKTTRILDALDAPLAARAIHAHRRIWRTGFIAEMWEWQPSRTDSADDALDAVAGAIAAMPVRLGGLATQAARPNWQAAQTIIVPTKSDEKG